MTFVKSLLHNLPDGKDVRRHRTHRSKKNQKRIVFQDKPKDHVLQKMKKLVKKEELDFSLKV